MERSLISGCRQIGSWETQRQGMSMNEEISLVITKAVKGR